MLRVQRYRPQVLHWCNGFCLYWSGAVHLFDDGIVWGNTRHLWVVTRKGMIWVKSYSWISFVLCCIVSLLMLCCLLGCVVPMLCAGPSAHTYNALFPVWSEYNFIHVVPLHNLVAHWAIVMQRSLGKHCAHLLSTTPCNCHWDIWRKTNLPMYLGEG